MPDLCHTPLILASKSIGKDCPSLLLMLYFASLLASFYKAANCVIRTIYTKEVFRYYFDVYRPYIICLL